MLSYIIAVVMLLAVYPFNNCNVNAFSNRHYHIGQIINIGSSSSKCHRGDDITHRRGVCNTSIIKSSFIKLSSSRLQTQLYNDNHTEETKTKPTTTDNNNDLEIIRGDKSNEISDTIWNDIEDGAPTQFEIMKNVCLECAFCFVDV